MKILVSRDVPLICYLVAAGKPIGRRLLLVLASVSQLASLLRETTVKSLLM
ncbi:hypothetical protein GBA52_027097, partial [Prunus armeniaca]